MFTLVITLPLIAALQTAEIGPLQSRERFLQPWGKVTPGRYRKVLYCTERSCTVEGEETAFLESAYRIVVQQRLNMELDLQSIYMYLGSMCTAVLDS